MNSRPSDKPNLLLLIADDQRFDMIGALGDPAARTPNLDRLAGRGTAFTRARIPGSTADAVCAPARAMLHTGRFLFGLQGEGQTIPDDHALLGERLRQGGYETLGVGKWHNGTASYARSFSGGGEIFFGGMTDHWNVPVCDFDPTGAYDKLRPVIPDPTRSRRCERRLVDRIRPGVHSTDLFAEATIEQLRLRDRSRPFFAYTAFLAPHDPRSMPDAYRRMYDPAKTQLPPNFQPAHAIDTGSLDVRDELLAARPRQESEVREHIAEYFAMITHLDAAVGRILDALDSSGDLENTIVVFTADHGLAVGQHGLMGKQSLYDHSLRVPLLFAGPEIARGRAIDDLVCPLDVFPTLCDWLGLSIPASVEGRSLASALRDGVTSAAVGRDALYLAYKDAIRGVTTGRRKLIEYASGETQLFDLESDPWERRNLADDSSAPEELARLRADLRRLFRECEGLAREDSRRFWSRRRDLGCAVEA